MSSGVKMKLVYGKPSYILRSRSVDASLTRLGGHLAPIVFRLQGRQVSPMHVAPWWKESPKGLPPILQVLRGDFFCLPFGGNDKPYKGEKHLIHGETANGSWQPIRLDRTEEAVELRVGLKLKVRPGRVEKLIRIVPGQTVVYQSHTVRDLSGRMSVGHHAMLKFPDEPGSGRLSFSSHLHAQNYVHPTEEPEKGGYSALLPGAVIEDLTRVPLADGGTTDLTIYPNRRGFEDITILCNDPKDEVAFSVVTFPHERYLWFALKDPKVLASTLLWQSNGGRHYSPWNGRHVSVLGVEEVTAFFHEGLASSVAKNVLSDRGITTSLAFTASKPRRINYIFGAAGIPPRFERVARMEREKPGEVVFLDPKDRRVTIGVDPDFLFLPPE